MPAGALLRVRCSGPLPLDGTVHQGGEQTRCVAGGPRWKVVTQMDDQARQGGTGPAGDDVAGGEPGNDRAVAAAGANAPGTGDPRVDAALKLLDRLPELPVGEHAAVFERVHAELTEVLGDLDPESAGTSG